MPPIAVHVQLAQVLQQLGGIQQQLTNMQQQLNDVQAGQDLLPMRLQNAAASLDAPLHYPVHVPIPAQAPQTKHGLMSLTAANCQIVAQTLNLPAFPNNVPITQRRQQIMDYLGCGITA